MEYRKIYNDIMKKNTEIIIKKKRYKEVLNYVFSVNIFPIHVQKKDYLYINRKIKKYEKYINYVANKLIKDNNTRQAILVFDTMNTRPNCIVCLQFQIRHNNLYITVFSRSLNIYTKIYCDVALAYKIGKILIKKINKKITIKNITFFVGNIHYI
jgi:thymidylate synthase